jgi:hypothetical protein
MLVESDSRCSPQEKADGEKLRDKHTFRHSHNHYTTRYISNIQHFFESYYTVFTYAEIVKVAFSPNVMAELDSDPKMPSSQPVPKR